MPNKDRERERERQARLATSVTAEYLIRAGIRGLRKRFVRSGSIGPKLKSLPPEATVGLSDSHGITKDNNTLIVEKERHRYVGMPGARRSGSITPRVAKVHPRPK
jgi:hypothetical protein